MPASNLAVLTDAQLHELLLGSSRTFALAIPQLPARLQREVTIAYLLFRIADTFEDANERWTRRRQLLALAAFETVLSDPGEENLEALAANWEERLPTEHRGYLELLRATPEVISSWLDLKLAARRTIGEHTRRTATLMARFVSGADAQGTLQLGGMDDLRRYCYAVAGIVGEMLTELFVLDCPELAEVKGYLRARAAAFGEGLQLVNILRDSAGDRLEGRNFLPPGSDRAEIFALARSDLDRAVEYCLAVQAAGAPSGVVAFVALPVDLAWATLQEVEARGPGAKISRVTVFRLHKRVQDAIAAGLPVLKTRGSGREA